MYYFRMFKRWFLMFSGKSQFHQAQILGKNFIPGKLYGYPSDLTNKINWQGKVNDNGIIINKLTNGEEIYFPIAIAQKALGHYDYFLLHNNESDIQTFLNYTDFLLNSMNHEGLISTWHKQERGYLNNYSAMTQGQVISCCCRAYIYTGNLLYKNAAIRASFHLRNLTDKKLLVKLNENDLALSECPNNNLEIVLNGWIFSLWGLLDLALIVSDKDLHNLNTILIQSLSNQLKYFDNGIWSKYDNNKNIASPFYHELHIQQLMAMYQITNIDTFIIYKKKWIEYNKSRFKKSIAILLKIKQKLLMRKYNEFI